MLELFIRLSHFVMCQPPIITLIKVSESSAQQVTLFLSNQLRSNKAESSASEHRVRLKLLHVVKSSKRNLLIRL